MGKAARPWVVEHLDWDALSTQAATQFGIKLPAEVNSVVEVSDETASADLVIN